MSEAERAVRVAAVMVTFCRPDTLLKTMGNVRKQSFKLDEIVVIDNDPARSARRHMEGTPDVTYLAMCDNLGPAGGLARGVEHLLASLDDDDWILFLDDDDPPSSVDDLRQLVAFSLSISDARLGAVGNVGARYDRRRGRMARVTDDQLTGVVSVDAIGGGQMPLYRAGALRSVGGPDAALFFGLDDLELGLRLRSRGWSLAVDGAAWRRRRADAGRWNLNTQDVRELRSPTPWREYYNSRNQVLIARQHGGRAAVSFAVMDGIARATRSLARREGSAMIRLTLRGVLDGIRRRSGRTVAPPRTSQHMGAAVR